MSPFPEHPMQPCTDSSELPGLLNQCLPLRRNTLESQWEEVILEHQVLLYRRYRQQFSLRLIPERRNTYFPSATLLVVGELTLGKNLN